MRKLNLLGIGTIVVIAGLVVYYFYLQGIDTKYAIKYSQVLPDICFLELLNNLEVLLL